MSIRNKDLQHLVDTALNDEAQLGDRLKAVRHLSVTRSTAATDALIQLARADTLDEQVGSLVGRSIAEILLRENRVDEAPLHDFSGSAYLVYDEAIALYQQSASRRSSKNK
jgi:hypothetical protein